MKLTKVRLINWHQFWRNTIDIENNTLLTGDNGSGKSTLLDAIFFVLSGGEIWEIIHLILTLILQE